MSRGVLPVVKDRGDALWIPMKKYPQIPNSKYQIPIPIPVDTNHKYPQIPNTKYLIQIPNTKYKYQIPNTCGYHSQDPARFSAPAWLGHWLWGRCSNNNDNNKTDIQRKCKYIDDQLKTWLWGRCSNSQVFASFLAHS